MILRNVGGMIGDVITLNCVHYHRIYYNVLKSIRGSEGGREGTRASVGWVLTIFNRGIRLGSACLRRICVWNELNRDTLEWSA